MFDNTTVVTPFAICGISPGTPLPIVVPTDVGSRARITNRHLPPRCVHGTCSVRPTVWSNPFSCFTYAILAKRKSPSRSVILQILMVVTIRRWPNFQFSANFQFSEHSNLNLSVLLQTLIVPNVPFITVDLRRIRHP
ncbi:hypothetical protein IAQ61_005303 [Plenodomus lingam]|nr:hypothetical protein IAQ61_005303 [Plenodomus lingam]